MTDEEFLAFCENDPDFFIEAAAEGEVVDPDREAVEIYRPGQTPETREKVESVAGEGPVEGFVLDLKLVRKPLED